MRLPSAPCTEQADGLRLAIQASECLSQTPPHGAASCDRARQLPPPSARRARPTQAARVSVRRHRVQAAAVGQAVAHHQPVNSCSLDVSERSCANRSRTREQTCQANPKHHGLLSPSPLRTAYLQRTRSRTKGRALRLVNHGRKLVGVVHRRRRVRSPFESTVSQSCRAEVNTAFQRCGITVPLQTAKHNSRQLAAFPWHSRRWVEGTTLMRQPRWNGARKSTLMCFHHVPASQQRAHLQTPRHRQHLLVTSEDAWLFHHCFASLILPVQYRDLASPAISLTGKYRRDVEGGPCRGHDPGLRAVDPGLWNPSPVGHRAGRRPSGNIVYRYSCLSGGGCGCGCVPSADLRFVGQGHRLVFFRRRLVDAASSFPRPRTPCRSCHGCPAPLLPCTAAASPAHPLRPIRHGMHSPCAWCLYPSSRRR